MYTFDFHLFIVEFFLGAEFFRNVLVVAFQAGLFIGNQETVGDSQFAVFHNALFLVVAAGSVTNFTLNAFQQHPFGRGAGGMADYTFFLLLVFRFQAFPGLGVQGFRPGGMNAVFLVTDFTFFVADVFVFDDIRFLVFLSGFLGQGGAG